MGGGFFRCQGITQTFMLRLVSDCPIFGVGHYRPVSTGGITMTYVPPSSTRQRQARPAPSEREQAVIMHLMTYANGNTFYSDILNKSMRYVLSEGQMACVERNFETDKVKAQVKADMIANKQVVVGGRNKPVIGKIVSLKFDTDKFNEPIAKVIIEQKNGTKLWGTIPVAVFTLMRVTLNEGDSLAFNANVSKASNDPTFGFFKFGANLGHFTDAGNTTTLPDGSYQWFDNLTEEVIFFGGKTVATGTIDGNSVTFD